MSTAVGSLADLGYILEETYGVVPPSPAFKKVRRVKTTLDLTKDTYASQEIRTDRQTADMRHGVRHVAGDIQGELSVGTYDDFMQALLGGTWTTGVSASQADFTSIVCSGGGKTFTAAGGSFITKGFKVGDVVQFTGLASTGNNAKNFTIVGLTALVMTVAETVVTDATPDTTCSVAVVGKKVLMGNTYRSFVIERQYTDISQYQAFVGCRMDKLALSLPPTGIVTSTWSVIGKDMNALTSSTLSTGSLSTVSTHSPLAAVSGVLRENATTLATVTGLTLNITNNLGGKPVIGANTIPDQLWGNACQITGQITALFQDATLLNKFVSETESNLEFRLDDPNGTDFLHFYIPRLKYTSGSIGDADPQGLPLTMNFTALAPTTTTNIDASSIVVQRSN